MTVIGRATRIPVPFATRAARRLAHVAAVRARAELWIAVIVLELGGIVFLIGIGSTVGGFQ